VRGRIESILNLAKVCEICTGENPARNTGQLDVPNFRKFSCHSPKIWMGGGPHTESAQRLIVHQLLI
jgi:hypothetical protein